MNNVIMITASVKNRVVTMIKDLYPNVGYVKVARTGIITRKRKWYSLRRTRIHITDLVLKGLPLKIFQKANILTNLQHVDARAEEASSVMLTLLYKNKEWEVFDYIWNLYSRNCVSVSDLYKPNANKLSRKCIPKWVFVSPKSMYGLLPLLKQGQRNKNRLKDKKVSDLTKTVNSIINKSLKIKTKYSFWPKIRLTA